MGVLKGLICVIAFIQICSAVNIYKDFKVYDVTPNKDQVAALSEWEYVEGIDFWSSMKADRVTRIMVSPFINEEFTDFLASENIKNEMTIEDVSSIYSEADYKIRQRRSMTPMADGPFNFTHYWSFVEFEMYVELIVRDYPNLVKKEVIGKSIEGRDIIALKVSLDAEFGNQPIIFVDSGTHAREWAGIQSTLYLLDQLVRHSADNKHILEQVDWVFVPYVNPDGFIHSYLNARLWRKNRRVVNGSCIGIDLNRNYPYVWRYVPNSCNGQGHPGPYAMSEPEIKANADYMAAFKNNLRLYLSVHTYGNYVLFPFGFDFDVWVNNWVEHIAVGQKFVDAIYAASGNTKYYELGNSADILYTANGASDDYAIAGANANLAYTLELTGGGQNGFDYPEAQIEALVKETFHGFEAFGVYIAEAYN